jgi:sigma-B regulation protein RsbU (phosphoserine phosphatase)
LVLGCINDIEYREEETCLEPGDIIYLYTDGVTEAMNSGRDLFSEERMVEVIQANKNSSPIELISIMKREIDSFAGGYDQADDITQLALQIHRYSEQNQGDSEIKELVIEADIANLNKVMDFLNAELESINCPSILKAQIQVVAEEVFTNIVNYAYIKPGGKAVISIKTGDEVKIKFEDFGLPFNPLEKPVPVLDRASKNREIGGLGIHLVRQFMDTVEYSRAGNRNILIMKKKIVTN